MATDKPAAPTERGSTLASQPDPQVETTDPAMARTVASNPIADAPVALLASADTLSAEEDSLVAPPPIEVGQTLGGRYEILGELGRGGEGVVLRARDHRADVVVALKLLADSRGGARLKRFRRELQAARQVTHPGVVRIYDLVELPGRFGLSMEYVEGDTLARRLERGGPLAVDEVVRLAGDLAEALAAAHTSGVTHRDLKPANVILRAKDGRAVITDFGVSRMHDRLDVPRAERKAHVPSQSKLTVEGALIGTPHYMAPEQLAGSADIGPPSDVYAFGIVVREAATGKLLHDATTLVGLQEARLRGTHSSLEQERPDLPPAFAAIIDRCLGRERDARYPDGRALAAALARLKKPSLPPPPAPPSPRGAPRRGWPLVALGTAAVAGVAMAAWRTPASRTPPAPSAPAPVPPAATSPPLAFQPTHARRITFDPGCEELPSWSPDGSTIVYDSPRGDEGAVYAVSVREGTTRKLTSGPGIDMGASIAPDGRRLAFSRDGSEDQSGAYVMNLDGSGSVRRLSKQAQVPSWTADGRGLWTGSDTHFDLVDADTGAVLRGVDVPPGYNASLSAALADGSFVVVFPHYLDTSGGGLGVFATDGAFRWIMHADLLESLSISQDGGHALVTRQRAGMAPELLLAPLDGTSATPLATSGIEAWSGAKLSPDFSMITWSTCRSRYELVRFDGKGAARALEPDAEWDDLRLAPVPGDGRLVTTSRRGGGVAAWLLDPDGHELPRAIATAGNNVANVEVSRDHRSVVLQLSGAGLRIVSLEGAAPERVLTTGATDARPRLTGDGRAVVFERQEEGHVVHPLRIALEGGDPSPLLEVGDAQPTPSPTDDRIAYLTRSGEGDLTVPMIWDPRRSTASPLSPGLGRAVYEIDRFSPDGRRLLVTRAHHEILEIDVGSGRVVRTLQSDGQLNDVAYLGAAIVATRGRMAGDLWLADGPFR